MQWLGKEREIENYKPELANFVVLVWYNHLQLEIR